MIYFKYIIACVKHTKTFDIMHCNDLNTLPIGVIVKKLFNQEVKVIYDAHEYETETGALRGIQKTLVKWLEKSLITYADKVITVSDMIATEYQRLYNIQKPLIVLNTPLYENILKKDIFRERFSIPKEETIFLYQGGLSRGRGLEVLLESFQRSQMSIVIMGYGPLEGLVKEYVQNNKNIYYHEAVSPEVLLDYTCSADIGISMIEDTCLSYRYCLPNKMFEYLMAELPVIVSNLPEMKKIVQENEVGIIAQENTAEGLLQACVQMNELDKKTLNMNIQKVKERYNWEEQEKILLKVYEDVIK